MRELRIPDGRGGHERLRLRDPADWPVARPGQSLSRVALAATHVVVDPPDVVPFREASIDFDAMLRFRRYIRGLGPGVAEAMGTARRGMGLNWKAAKPLRQHRRACGRRPGLATGRISP